MRIAGQTVAIRVGGQAIDVGQVVTSQCAGKRRGDIQLALLFKPNWPGLWHVMARMADR